MCAYVNDCKIGMETKIAKTVLQDGKAEDSYYGHQGLQ